MRFLSILNLLCIFKVVCFYQADRAISGKTEDARAEAHEGAARERRAEGTLYREDCLSDV
jgi:hypothetical protein